MGDGGVGAFEEGHQCARSQVLEVEEVGAHPVDVLLEGHVLREEFAGVILRREGEGGETLIDEGRKVGLKWG